MADNRVDVTTKPVKDVHLTQTVGAADTGPDLVCQTKASLVCPVGVGDLSATHGDAVGFARRENLFCLIRSVDCPDGGDGNLDACGFYCGGVFHVDAPR